MSCGFLAASVQPDPVTRDRMVVLAADLTVLVVSEAEARALLRWLQEALA